MMAGAHETPSRVAAPWNEEKRGDVFFAAPSPQPPARGAPREMEDISVKRARRALPLQQRANSDL
jgi:hypothetical protein